MTFVEPFDPKSIKFDPKTRSDTPLYHKELESFCQHMANGVIGEAICWYKLTDQKHKSLTQAKTLANKLVSKHLELENRILFLKGDLACIEAFRNDFSREDLCEILIDRLKDDETHSRDISALANTLASLKGWNAPTQINVKSELTHVLETLNTNAALPMYDRNCIDTYAKPI